MATAALCGMNGTVTGPSGVTEVTYWEITQNQEAAEATSFASGGWKERVACLKGASGSFKSIGHKSTVGLHPGCSFKDTTLAGSYTIAGAIVISKVTVSTPVEGIITYNHDFNFTGAITAG